MTPREHVPQIGLPQSDVPLSEWDLLLEALRQEGGAMALAEVESAAQADDVARRIRREIGGRRPVHLFSVHSAEDWPRALAWIEQQEAQSEGQAAAVYLIDASGEPPARDDEQGRKSWNWISFQRERWNAGRGKPVFLLTPPQVDNVARWAPALWEWVLVRVCLVQFDQHRESAATGADAPTRPAGGQRPGDAAALVPSLRDQLFRARLSGTPAAILRREYAWPLLEALVEAGYVGEAHRVLQRELAGDFAAELPSRERVGFWSTIGWLGIRSHDLTLAENAYSSLLDGAQHDGVRENLARAYHGLGIVAQEQRQWQQAEQHYFVALEVYRDSDDAHSLGICLGNIARLWQATGNDQLVARAAEALKQEAEDVRKLFEEATRSDAESSDDKLDGAT